MLRRRSSSASPWQQLPDDADAHFALGSLLMQEKKYPEAQQELMTAVKLSPDMADIYGNLAVVAAENKNYRSGHQRPGRSRQILAGDSCDVLLAGDIV